MRSKRIKRSPATTGPLKPAPTSFCQTTGGPSLGQACSRPISAETPLRCQYIRVIVSELARLYDHLTCCGMAASELGAITAGFYMIEARELITRIIENLTGARLTVTYVRIGGLKHDLPHDFAESVARAFKTIRKLLDDCDRLLSRNRIFLDRLSNVGVISQETALSYCLTGPILRASGVDYDVRKAFPYLVYDQLDFEVPVGSRGDNYDRFLCRIREIEQSMKIVEQALANLPVGPVWINDPRFVMPEKEKAYGSIEGLMHQFKIIMEGIHVPAGETYFAVEGGNGELGFYIVSDGGGRPYRIRVRPPCFINLRSLKKLCVGHLVADVVAIIGTLDIVLGEIDR